MENKMTTLEQGVIDKWDKTQNIFFVFGDKGVSRRKYFVYRNILLNHLKEIGDDKSYALVNSLSLLNLLRKSKITLFESEESMIQRVSSVYSPFSNNGTPRRTAAFCSLLWNGIERIDIPEIKQIDINEEELIIQNNSVSQTCMNIIKEFRNVNREYLFSGASGNKILPGRISKDFALYETNCKLYLSSPVIIMNGYFPETYRIETRDGVSERKALSKYLKSPSKSKIEEIYPYYRIWKENFIQ